MEQLIDATNALKLGIADKLKAEELSKSSLAAEGDFELLLKQLNGLDSDPDCAKMRHCLSATKEALPAFMWRLLPPAISAKEHVQACKEATQFYTNRALSEARQTANAKLQSWANALVQTLNGIQVGELENPKNGFSSSAGTVCSAVREGNRWIVRNARNVTQPIHVQPTISEAVFIEDCEKCLVQVSSKTAAIVINKCKRITVSTQDVVSTVEMLSCADAVLKLGGSVPTVVLDSDEGVQVHLGHRSLGAELLTSKCSEINVCVDKNGEDITEIPVPFQFKSRLDASGKLITVPVTHTAA